MADSETPTPEEQAAPEEQTAPPKGAMSGLIFAIIAAVAGAAIGGGVLAPRLGGGGGDGTPTAHDPPRQEKRSGGHGGGGSGGHGSGGEGSVGTMVELTNVIVNPSGSQGSRFLMATVVIEVEPRQAGEELREREVQVRDAIISVLEGKTLRQLTRTGARDSVKAELGLVVAKFLPSEAHASVYLPRFVIQ